MRVHRSGEINPVVAGKLRDASRRWKHLLFWRLLSGLVILISLILIVMGLLIRGGWISSSVVAKLLVVLLTLVFLCGLVVLIIVANIWKKPNSWLAGELEKRLPSLLDRLHTLAYLECRPRDGITNAFYQGIGHQAGNELAKRPDIRPISSKTTLLFVVTALTSVMGVWEFYVRLDPWQAFHREGLPTEASRDSAEFSLPDESASEVRQVWGEVRITEPGGDLKLTKVDVLPLTIEAASSSALHRASWTTSVNGGSPSERNLPAPQEPNYAVYQPYLFLDELRLADWDVLSYFAQVATEGDGRYASEIYFVEIRPFREDLLKLENAGGGGKKECLNKLRLLIQKQQDILRQTYHQIQKPSPGEDQKQQDQEKLRSAQGNLSVATAHLYAEVAQMEHENVATVLDQLALAQDSMDGAVEKLGQPDNPVALIQEQQALQQLVEARKDFVKQISDGGGNSGSGSDDSPPVAGGNPQSTDQLPDIADLRDEGKAAIKAVRDAKQKQTAIANEMPGKSEKERQDLAKRQTAATQELREFQEKVPAPFQGLEKATSAADAAMKEVAASLQKKKPNADSAQQALQALAELETQLSERLSRRAIGDVYRMKAMLDGQAAGFEQMEKQPGQYSPEDFRREAGRTKSTKDAMTQAFKETGKAFGPDLGKALEGTPGQQLDRVAEQMQNAAGNPRSAGEIAGRARSSLAEIAKAFEASKPTMLRGTGAADENEKNPLRDAMQMLNSIAQHLDEGQKMDAEMLKKQLEDVHLALLEESGNHPDEAAPLVAVTEALASMREKVDMNINATELRKLVDQLETYRLEMADHERTAPIDPNLLHADSASAPSEFRERVRRYFEKLSDN